MSRKVGCGYLLEQLVVDVKDVPETLLQGPLFALEGHLIGETLVQLVRRPLHPPLQLPRSLSIRRLLSPHSLQLRLDPLVLHNLLTMHATRETTKPDHACQWEE